jgi:hypothetical protein
VSPSVAPGSKVRRAASTIGRERRGNLHDCKLLQGGFDHHFTGEFHARRSQIESDDRIASKTTDTAVEITNGAAEQHPANCRENGVSEIAMQSWHRTRFDAAGEAVPHHQIGTAAERLEEWAEVGKVVAVVGVGHDHECALGFGDSGHEGGPVATNRHIDHPCPFISGNALRAIGAAVVGDHDLAINSQRSDR